MILQNSMIDPIPFLSLNMLLVRRLILQSNAASLGQSHQLGLALLVQIRKAKTIFLTKESQALLSGQQLRWIKELIIARVEKTRQHGL